MKLLFVVSNFYKEYSRELLKNSLLELFNQEDLKTSEFKNTGKNEFTQCIRGSEPEVTYMDIVNLAIEESETDSIFRFKISDYKNAIIHDITIASIIGSMEIPQVISFFLERHKYDGVIAIGVIKKGATKHDEYVTEQALNGISRLAIDHKLPITSAIITAHTDDLIKERIEVSGYNVGGNAVKTCHHLISLKQKIQTIK